MLLWTCTNELGEDQLRRFRSKPEEDSDLYHICNQTDPIKCCSGNVGMCYVKTIEWLFAHVKKILFNFKSFPNTFFPRMFL